MTKFAAKLALASALILAPMSLPAMSQTGTGTGTGTGTDTTTQDAGYHQEGRNGYWGLLGLLGLFGLMGRKSSRDEHSSTGATAYRDPADVSGTRDRY
ncbi:WGxxGxxG family protein [Leptolyngbya sp. FACHB-17]|uniref:WGxxGxxG family protein n=1 Tax=unclassified Leptolyngbya TaxID=2650499 RepID=UPI001681A56A|nr:WGxxGxxG family protein [Leptolyngbya sp. FACHB-17]MBD2083180.1 hypothetical protein [Leptolyngbya sp. FACHB-17]